MHDDFPILAAIAASPANPHQVLEHLAATGLTIPRSTLYRRIDALISDGLISATEAIGAQPRALSLSHAGRERLARDASAVLEREPLESPRFALAVTCAGLADGIDPGAVLRRRMSETARSLTGEERSLNALASRDDYWTMAGRERRIAHLQADIAWLQSMMARRRIGPSTAELQDAPPARAAG
jgi:DNA-binding PadR family transcriptional regulator